LRGIAFALRIYRGDSDEVLLEARPDEMFITGVAHNIFNIAIACESPGGSRLATLPLGTLRLKVIAEAEGEPRWSLPSAHLPTGRTAARWSPCWARPNARSPRSLRKEPRPAPHSNILITTVVMRKLSTTLGLWRSRNVRIRSVELSFKDN
jgi:hypothetical protein